MLSGDSTTVGSWLPCEESNPDLLVQSQVCFRLHHSALAGPLGPAVSAAGISYVAPVAEGEWIEHPWALTQPRVSNPAHYLSANLPEYPRHDSNVHASA